MRRAPTMPAAGPDKFTPQPIARHLVGNRFHGRKDVILVPFGM